MTIFPLVHLAATVGFCVLLWVVQVAVYPQMGTVRDEDFMMYHERHTRLIAWLVGPLFLMEGGCAALAFWWGWQAGLGVQLASVGLFAANSLLTFLWFVPAHLHLGCGKDEVLMRRVVAMNWWRTGLSTLRVVVVMGLF